MTFLATRAARRAAHILTVLLLMACGLFVLFFNIYADSANFDGLGKLSDLGVTRFAIGWIPLLALPFYRRSPLVVMAIGAISALFAHNDPFVLAVGLTVWMSRTESTAHKWLSGAGIAAITANGIIHLVQIQHWQDSSYISIGRILIALQSALAILLSIGISSYVRERRRTRAAEYQAKYAQNENRDLHDDLARQQEREELAREVHDTLASRLSTIAMQAGSLEDDSDPELHEAAQAVRVNASRALDDLRSLLVSLRKGRTTDVPPPSIVHGSLADVVALMDDANHSGLTIRPFVALDDYQYASDALHRAVYRITQEALVNALRYSSDQIIDVHIEGNPASGIRMEFHNRYSETATFTGGAGKGLLGIEERLALLGGTLVRTQADGWFSLKIGLPWRSAEIPA